MVIEDITTHSYMKLYGPKNVKGGRFLGSYRKRYKRFLLFEERGYLSNLTKLYCEFDITYSGLEQLGILAFAKSGANSCFVMPTILYAKNQRLNKEFALQKLIEKWVLCQHPTFNQIQKSK
ncbi:MAG: hypothetical protein NWP64_02125 [Maribacter sp.]|nr:hypothetical protein [Maribacter sp.]